MLPWFSPISTTSVNPTWGWLCCTISSTSRRTSLRSGFCPLDGYGSCYAGGANLPLFSLENKRPLYEFEIIGVSLPYETVYTNFLNILDLHIFPSTAASARKTTPWWLPVGRQSSTLNRWPPLSDAFVIGEGEEAILDVVRLPCLAGCG